MGKLDQEREEWIRSSSRERGFLDWYVGARHPASTRSRAKSRRNNPAVWLIVVLIGIPFLIQLIQMLFSLFSAG